MRRLTSIFIGGGILGLFWMILAGVRWMWVYPDTSQAVMGMLIGIGGAIVFFGFAYCYERINDIEDRQRAHEMRWDSFIQDNKSEEELNNWKKKNK